MNDKRHSFAVHSGCHKFQTSAPVLSPALAFVPVLTLVVLIGLVYFSEPVLEVALAISPALVAKNKELETKQAVIAKVYETAGENLDFSKVKRIGEEDVSKLTTKEKIDKIKTLDKELNDLYDEAKSLAAAEAAFQNIDRRKGTMHPGPSDPDGPKPAEIKSLGELVARSKEFKEHFVDRRDKSGRVFNFHDAYPSDFIKKAYFKTLFETTAGWAPESVRLPGFVEAVTRPVQILDIIPMGRTGQEQIVFMEETTRTHAAAEKAEGAAFAESTFALTEKTSPVRKITDSIPVTDEQLEDVAQSESYLNGRLTFGLRQRLDTQVLVGTGVAPNLDGIKNVTGINTQAKGADPIPDAIHKAMRLVRVTGRAMPTHIVLHPEDWERVRLLKTADGIYIYGSPAEASMESMWGLPVIQSDIDSVGRGYVGSFMPAWISLFERRGVDVQVGFTGTQFVEGKRTIRADMRFAFVVFRPAAFTEVTGLNA